MPAAEGRAGAAGGRPLVSAMIVVRDGARFLADSIGSVHAQTYEPLELIVLENGSSDESYATALALAPEDDVTSSPALDLAQGRNAALARAHGEWLAFLDADDIWPPQRTAQLVAAAQSSGAAMVFGDVETFHCPLQDAAEHARLPAPLRRSATLPTNGITHRKVAQAVGDYRSEMGLAEWGDWLLRARTEGFDEHQIEELTLRRRLHTDSLTFTRPESTGDYARAMLAGIRARRAAAGGSAGESKP